MLHSFADDGNRGQSAFGLHAEHGASFDFLGELLVQYVAGGFRVLIADTDAGAVLGGGLRDHEDRDAVLCQYGEDAAVHTDDADHGEAGDGDERGALDAGDTLDEACVVRGFLLNDGAGGIGVEGVLDEDGDVLDADGIDGGRVDHLGAEVAELHRFDVTELRDDIGSGDDTRVGGHESIDVGPDLENAGIEGCCDDAGGVVRTATTEVGDLTTFGVCRDEARHERYLGHFLPRLTDKVGRQFAGQSRPASLHLGLDELAAVVPYRIAHQGGHDLTAEAFAIADDGGVGLWRQVADEVHALIDAAQFLEQTVDNADESLALVAGRDDGSDEFVVATGHLGVGC